MIRLHSGSILLNNGDGGEAVLSIDALREELSHCCQAADIGDPDFADDILAVVRDFLTESRESGLICTRVDLDELIARILVDTGLREVAAHYCECRDLTSHSNAERLVAASKETIVELLRGDPFFLTKPIAGVAERIAETVQNLGFAATTERFLLELGRTIWCQPLTDAHRIGPVHPSSDRRWLLDRSEIVRLFSATEQQFITSGTITFRPISCLLPRISVHVRLTGLVGENLQPVVPELHLFPAFDALCGQLRSMIHRLSREIHNRVNGNVVHEGLPLISFVQLRELATDNLRLADSAVPGLRRELGDIAAFNFEHTDKIHYLFD